MQRLASKLKKMTKKLKVEGEIGWFLSHVEGRLLFCVAHLVQFDGTASRSYAILLLATSKLSCNTNEGQVNSMVVFKTNGLLASTGSIHLE